MRIRVHGTFMDVAAAAFMTTLKPHDQGICPFPNERWTIAHPEVVLEQPMSQFAKLTRPAEASNSL
jgi:hypothetical protein